MSIGIRHSITSGQCRAARALLDITQPELAEAAGLGLSTIVDFEKSRRDVSRAAVHAIQKALEKAGIQFVAKNGGGRASGCGYSRIALRLSVIGQRVLRLPPTVPLITRSLGVSATMDRGCDKSERLQWFARSQVGKTVYTRQQIEGHGETHVHGKHEYSAKPCRASGVRDSGYRRSLLGLR